ncbi:hypothetical protein SLEP1_g40485 [Rubroshorea leprosula]|uniref:Uncharacterized protein n=1 Tax=Rubroshorea leprosula TaxID=152421 RepID=A0AAV5L401_9ROSI|nr:hypothetical protein SLEP1_g40485 [Rubroshorea leprosula]
MDTSNPAAFVNGGLLRMHLGRKVRAVIQVIRSDVGSVIGKSTDDSQIIVKGSPPIPPTNYVEVIGVAETDNSIRAEIWTNFGDTFDMSSYDQLCQLANGEFKHLFL